MQDDLALNELYDIQALNRIMCMENKRIFLVQLSYFVLFQFTMQHDLALNQVYDVQNLL